MVAKNDITGDDIKSKGNSDKFKEGMDKIKPSCYNDCKYLMDTYTKCRVCAFHPKNQWNEERIDIVGSNGNDGGHYNE